MIQKIDTGDTYRMAVVLPDVYQTFGNVDSFGDSLLDALHVIVSHADTKQAVLCETMDDLLELAMIFKNLK